MTRVSLQTLIDRSTKNMGSGIHAVVKASAIEMIRRAYTEDINVQISSGFRSFAEQTRLYNQGRTTSGSIVTNARAGQSNHNYGLAIDYFLTSEDGAKALWNVNAQWRRVAAIGKTLGFVWGGDWSSFKDYPHLEMMGGLTIRDLQNGRRPNLKTNFVPSESPQTGGTQVKAPKPAKQTQTGSSHIRAAQSFANSRNYPTKARFTPLVVDGFNGPKTNDALTRIYQYFAGVAIDGVFGPQSRRNANTLRQGSTHKWWVHLLQSALNAKGATLAVDGAFGPATDSAVKTFQRGNRLVVDGIAGPDTWEALLK